MFAFLSAYGTSCTRDLVQKRAHFQLRTVLQRTQVSKEVKSNVHAAEDLLEVVTKGHVLAVAMTVKGVTKLEDMSLTKGEQNTSSSEHIEDTFVTPIFFEENLPSDQVTLCARELMFMGLLRYSFKDAISEGDGPVVMSYWKVMTVVFRLTNHRK